MKTGVKILTNSDKIIAQLICSCKHGGEVVAASGFGTAIVHNRIAEWKKYYNVRDFSELANVFRNKQFNS